MLIIAGVVILPGRRLLVSRVRATTSPVGYVALILLLIIIVTGVVPTLFVNLFGHGYDYRTTVAPWFRGLFTGSPDVTASANAPVVYQVHASSAWLIWAVWPFSRLVHAWSVPLRNGIGDDDAWRAALGPAVRGLAPAFTATSAGQDVLLRPARVSDVDAIPV